MKMTEHDASENIELQSPLMPPWLHEIIHEQGRLTITDHEAARLLGVSRGSVRAAIAAHEIEVVHLGRRLLILLIPLLKTMGLEVLPDVEPSRLTARDDPTRSMHVLS